MAKSGGTTTTIPQALETFAAGYCFTRSRTHPYEWRKVEGLLAMRDGPRASGKDYRREEWVAFGKEPREVDRIVRAQAKGHFCICAIRRHDQELGPMRDAYKALGYRLTTTEPLFFHDLRRIARVDSPATIERVRDRELAERFAKAWKMKPMPAEWLAADSPIRQFVALIDGKVIGAVASVRAGERNWVSGLYVLNKHRRKGIASALMARMLREDRTAGSLASVLLASHVGAKLYASIGYQPIGELLLLTPRR